MLRLTGLFLAVLACLIALTSASPVAPPKAAQYTCTARDQAAIPILAGLVRNPGALCTWWSLKPRSNSPWPALPVKKLNGLCKCLKAEPTLTPKTTLPAPKPLSKQGTPAMKAIARLRNQTSKPLVFCRFWTMSANRKKSPFATMKPSGIYLACDKLLKSAATNVSSASHSATTTTTPSSATTTSVGATSSASVTLSFSSNTMKADTTSSVGGGATKDTGPSFTANTSLPSSPTTTQSSSSPASTISTHDVSATSTQAPFATNMRLLGFDQPLATQQVDSEAVATTSASTTSATSATTTNQQTAATRDPLCNAAGFQWGYYQSTAVNTAGTSFSAFDPTIFASQVPSAKGRTTQVILNQRSGSPDLKFYDSTASLPTTSYALVHRGFFIPPKDGRYQITVAYSDDITLIWTGEKARSGWTRSNADLIVTSDDSGSLTFTTDSLYGGDYVPMRILFGQSDGAALLLVTITHIDGTEVLGANTPATAQTFTPDPCTSIIAEPFPAFGQEMSAVVVL